ncbi:MAG: hypothetical protein ACT4OI_02245 [Methanobacteriota archaeon]
MQVGLVVSLLLVGALGLVSARGNPSTGISPGPEPLQAATLAYEFSDFYNVPYSEWWDYRTAVYGDLPINAECFSATGVANGICTPTDPLIPDVSGYPYTNWYPLPGTIKPGTPGNNPMIYAPYRFRATGVDIPGYSLTNPVFLPTLNPSAPIGSRLEFDWHLTYLDTATTNALEAAGCPISTFDLDGFQTRQTISLTLDLAESKRVFGVPIGATAADAGAWWAANTNPSCLLKGSAESSYEQWLVSQGGPQREPGAYDVPNSFEYYYVPFFTQVAATVDADGTTHVMIDHVAWGGEVVVARWFYWGAASYRDNYLDSTRAAGWWGMELAWFEQFAFTGSVGASNFDFQLSTVMQYHFQHLAQGGVNGVLDHTDDVPIWTWGPILSDYTNDWSPAHTLSELDRYPTACYTHSTPGSPSTVYGMCTPYDYAPIRWDLAAGQSWRFTFPAGDVVFYDPNLTPLGAVPTLGQFVEIRAPLGFARTRPAGFGTFDALTNTWTVTGPALTGGPAGSPGTDGIPGTADDQYALESWGAILFQAAPPPPPEQRVADLVGRSAWPRFHHLDKSSRGTTQTLFARVANLGNQEVAFEVTWEIRDAATGALVATVTATGTVSLGGQVDVSQTVDVSAWEGKFAVRAWVEYDRDGDGTPDTMGAKLKSFSFAVVP